MYSFRSAVAASLTALALLAGCGDDGGTGGGDQPTLTLELTDAPGDLAHAWVEITQIALQGTGGETVLLDSSTGLVDLLTLATTTRELVADVPIPPGTYAQLRIVIASGVIESGAGDVFVLGEASHPEGKTQTGDLACPSCTQSGIKINLPGGGLTLEDEAKVVVLDFDVSQSFGKEAGRSGRWVMRPSMTASEVGVSGSISGNVTLADGVSLPDCGGTRSIADFVPLATAVEDAEQVKSGVVEATDGSYSIRFVAPGDWQIGFDSSIEFEGGTLEMTDVDVSSSSVTVSGGAAAEAHFVINAATCTLP